MDVLLAPSVCCSAHVAGLVRAAPLLAEASPPSLCLSRRKAQDILGEGGAVGGFREELNCGGVGGEVGWLCLISLRNPGTHQSLSRMPAGSPESVPRVWCNCAHFTPSKPEKLSGEKPGLAPVCLEPNASRPQGIDFFNCCGLLTHSFPYILSLTFTCALHNKIK